MILGGKTSNKWLNGTKIPLGLLLCFIIAVFKYYMKYILVM